MNAPTDVIAVLRKASRSVPNEDFVAFDDAIFAVAELIEAAANVVADIRANKEPDLIALADCIKAAGGRDVLKASLSKVEGKTYTLADHANIRSAS